MGLPVADANAILDDIRADTPHLQLHTGDPGADGTANVAATSDRSALTFDPADGGQMVCTGGDGWADTEAETWTHYTIWNASTVGTLRWKGQFMAALVNAGAAKAINSGAIVIGFTDPS